MTWNLCVCVCVRVCCSETVSCHLTIQSRMGKALDRVLPDLLLVVQVIHGPHHWFVYSQFPCP